MRESNLNLPMQSMISVLWATHTSWPSALRGDPGMNFLVGFGALLPEHPDRRSASGSATSSSSKLPIDGFCSTGFPSWEPPG